MLFKLFSTVVMITLAGSIASIPKVAQAGPANVLAQSASTLQIDEFSVEPIDQLTPGNELVFTLRGTPNARATLTISNVVTNLPMQETDTGVYEGRYTIRSRDQFSDTTIVRANLSRGNRVTSVRLQDPLVATTNSNSERSAQLPEIDRFTAQPVEQLEPGTELTFSLVGTPKAQATFSIEGVALNQTMREVSPGNYEGRYVIRRQDYFGEGVNVTASLRSAGQTVRARLDRSLVASGSTSTNTQLPIEIISPQNNSRVSGAVQVQGRSAPNTTINVTVKARNSVAGLIGIDRNILNQRVQTDAQGNFTFNFNPSIPVSGTRYEVSLSAERGSQTTEKTLTLVQR